MTPWATILAAVLAVGTALQPATAAASSPDPSAATAPFDPARAPFTVKVSGELLPYRQMAVFAMPGEQLTLAASPAGPTGAYRVDLQDGTVHTTSGRWRWQAPTSPGLYPVRITDTSSGAAIVLNVFVLVPASRVAGGVLNGYRIGSYPVVAHKGLDIYRPPRGFVEVTRANSETAVSPHFTLGQFLCKQDGGWPRYLVLRERLVIKLELLLEKVNEAGHRCDSFAVMSGYRTPHYNRMIGNVTYSRHLWGGAADIFVDADPVDGIMDDLNRDGRFDLGDAHVLYEIADRLYGAPWYEPLVGGLAAYRRTGSHGPFIHVDARGFRARWGE